MTEFYVNYLFIIKIIRIYYYTQVKIKYLSFSSSVRAVLAAADGVCWREWDEFGTTEGSDEECPPPTSW